MANCDPPYERGTGCCGCCPPEVCEGNIVFHFTLTKGGSTVLTDCCEDPINTSLQIEITPINCSCFDITTIDLNYDALEGGWIGSLEFCDDETMELLFFCSEGSFLLFVTISCGFGGDLLSAVSGSCDPFSFDFETSISGVVDCNCESNFGWTFTVS